LQHVLKHFAQGLAGLVHTGFYFSELVPKRSTYMKKCLKAILAQSEIAYCFPHNEKKKQYKPFYNYKVG
jgi:hypothetical protein